MPLLILAVPDGPNRTVASQRGRHRDEWGIGTACAELEQKSAPAWWYERV
jgi:hypothetical protein